MADTTSPAPSDFALPPIEQLTGIGLKVGSAFLFTLMGALIKWVSEDLPTGQIVFARSFFAIVPIVVMLTFRRELQSALRTRRLALHVGRSMLGVAAMFASFAALARLPLPDATAIGYAAPLITVVLAVVLLKERVRVYRWTAVGVGLVGVMIMLSPHLGDAGGSERSIGVGLALGAAAGAALAMIQVRRLTATENTATIVFYFSALSAAIALFTLPLGWAVPSPTQAALMVLIGLIGGVAQIMLTHAYRFADASLIAPFEYTTILWATVIGYVVFGNVPSGVVVVGSLIVVASGVFVIWREGQLGLARAPERSASKPPTS